MLLLDIIAIPRRVPDTTRVIPKPIIRDTISAPSDTTDTVASTFRMAADGTQLADVAPIPPKLLEQFGGSTLVWAVIAVLLALGLCFYFIRSVRKYR